MSREIKYEHERDRQTSENLEDFLSNKECYQSIDESRLIRSTIIDEIKCLAKEWIMEMVEDNEERKSKINGITQYIYPLGSYVLEVMEKDSNLDLVFIAPSFISIDDFLNSFAKKLEQCPNVKEIHPIEIARNITIKALYIDVEVGLTFTNPDVSYLNGENDIYQPNIYGNMDSRTAFSLNGYHTIQDILKIIPNRQTFQIALRAIKLWAKQKGFYSRRLGIMGGTSWTILVVYICQRFPRASPSQLIYQFFNIYREWSWPKPVEIKQFIGKNVYVKNLKIFDFGVSRLVRDKNALMPILTPSFPRNNSAFRITRSTKSLIVEEFQKGFTICKEIVDRNGDWTALFEPYRFFDKYEQFIVITGNTIENYRSKTYSVIESKIRVLTRDLEKEDFLKTLQVLPNPFDSTIDDECRIWFIGIKMEELEDNFPTDLLPHVDMFENTTLAKLDEVGVERADVDLKVSCSERKELRSLPKDVYDKIIAVE
ncbi:unnamed protein product [Dimorphilus gyrociliatus]|uniref:polynucleotide adenylyltransferase n=1 Tax=Dimorphilus gyrociliatus TaxID=2664684 RepID=A0A7I8V5V3_9ANNE|nr:unnamed protein product [Dimorphilus gyrociliatus]